MAEQSDNYISCIILAGGRGTRMQGEDKGLAVYQGRPLIAHVIDRLTPAVDDFIISANRNLREYAAYAPRVITDEHPGFAGPLAGIASCLPHCSHALALVVACDMPRLPAGLVNRLSESVDGHELSVASCGSRMQLALLLNTGLLASIKQALEDNQHKLMDWIKSRDAVIVEYSDCAQFANLNTLHDLDPLS